MNPPRIELPGAWYHIVQTGRAPFFQTPADYSAFLVLLRGVAETWSLNIAAYCLAPHCYHLLFQTALPNLAHCMLQINSGLARRMKRLRGLEGRILRNRYKVTLLDPEHFLLVVARRVHQTPLRHHHEEGLQYPWSSYKAYLGGSTGRLLAKQTLLELLPGDSRERRQAFRRFMAMPEDPGFACRYRRGAFPLILGDDAFIARCLNTASHIHAESASDPRICREVIRQAVCAAFGTTEAALMRGGQGIRNQARAAYMHLLRSLRGETLADIAAHCGLARHSSAGSTIRRFETQLRKNPGLRATLQQIVSRMSRAHSSTRGHAASISPSSAAASED